MLLLARWFVLSQPVFRIAFLIGFPCCLLAFLFLPAGPQEWVGWMAQGYVQSVFVAFLSAALVLMASALFFRGSDRSEQRHQIRHDDAFVSRLIWPHRIVAIVVFISAFSYFADLSKIEAQLLLALTLINFCLYVVRVNPQQQRFDFLRFVESGVILIVSAFCGIGLSLFAVLLFERDWNPFDERGLRLLFVFCASVQVAYAEYLTRKHERMARALAVSSV